MKFHNQKSFMGHGISNVKNKPLLHKKGKQWIVVAISALVLAGFGGMVSTTTHADTTNQPTTNKVVQPNNQNTKPSNSTKASTVMPQAQGMHKALINNAAVQKTNAPSSAVTKKTAPASTTSTTSAKSSVASNDNSSNNNIRHTLGAMPSVLKAAQSSDELAPQGVQQVTSGNWGTARWNYYNNGQLDIHDGTITNTNSDEKFNGQQSNVISIYTHNVIAPSNHDMSNLFASNGNGGRYFTKLKTIDLSGLNTAGVTNMAGLFHGDGNLKHIYFGTKQNFDTSQVWSMDSMFDDDWKIQSLDMSMFDTSNVTDFVHMFWNTPGLRSLDISNFKMNGKPSVTDMFTMNEWGILGEASGSTNGQIPDSPGRASHLEQLVLPNNSNNNNFNWSNTNLSNRVIDVNGANNSGIIDGKTVQNNNGKEQLEKIGSNGEPDTTTKTSDWSKVASNPGNWVNTAITKTYTINARDTVNNNQLIPNWSESITGLSNGDFLPFDSTKLPSGYELAPGQGKTIPLQGNPTNKTTLTVNVVPTKQDTVIYTYKGQQVPSNQGNYHEAYTPVGEANTADHNSYNNINWYDYGTNHMPTNWNIVGDGSQNFTYDGGTHYVHIAPNSASDTIVYETSPHNVISKQHVSGPNNTVTYPRGLSDDCIFNANTLMPSGYYATGKTQIPYSYDGKKDDNPQVVTIAPYSDSITYYDKSNNNNVIGNHKINVNTLGIINNSNNTFTVPTNYNIGLPSNYVIVGGDGDNNGLTFDYHNSGSHKVYVEPKETDTVDYVNNRKNIGTDTHKNGLFNDTFTSNVPTGYHTNTNATTMSFKYDGGTHTVNVYPNQITLHFNDNLGTENISNLTGTTYQIKGSNLPNHYQLANNNSDEMYLSDGSNYDIKLVPSKVTDTINYMNGKNKVSSKTVNGTYTSNIPNSNIINNIPNGYELVNSNNNISFKNGSHNVAVTPIQKTDVINYMNGDVKVASDVYTGNMYAPNVNHTSFNANDYVPAGYHVVNDGGNTFYFDGQTHDVTVYPNRITLEFNNGQVGSKQVDNLKGTTYQIKSSDVPANYQLTNPSNNVVDLGDLGKSVDYNVDVTPIQQQTPSAPSDNIQPAPYIPSIPSSEASTPASVATPISDVTTKAKPTYYGHYRYTKVVTPLQLHTSKHFTKKNGVLTIKHPTSFKIMKIVHDHKYARYEVRYQGRNYFITANPMFTINNYVQKHDFKSHKHMTVKVITPLIEYKHARFNRKYAIKVFKKGAVLPVKRVFTIGKGEMTRFELTNGRFVTSNKLFVKVIK